MTTSIPIAPPMDAFTKHLLDAQREAGKQLLSRPAPNPTPDPDDPVYCPDCGDFVYLDDGCCGCGKVLDDEAFEEAEKLLAELNADPDADLYREADYRYDLMREERL